MLQPAVVIATTGFQRADAIAGPLIVWLAKKDSSPFVRNAAAGAFNFTLSMWLVGLVGWILTFTVIFAVVGIPMIVISALGSIVLGAYGLFWAAVVVVGVSLRVVVFAVRRAHDASCLGRILRTGWKGGLYYLDRIPPWGISQGSFGRPSR